MRAASLAIPATFGFLAFALVGVWLTSWFAFLAALLFLLFVLALPGRPVFKTLVPSQAVRRGLGYGLAAVAFLLTVQFLSIPSLSQGTFGLSLGLPPAAIGAMILAVLGLALTLLWLALWHAVHLDPAPWKLRTFRIALAVFFAAPLLAMGVAFAFKDNPSSPVDDLFANQIAPTVMVLAVAAPLVAPFLGAQGAHVEARFGRGPIKILQLRPSETVGPAGGAPEGAKPRTTADVYRSTFASIAEGGAIGPGERRSLDLLAWNLGLSPAEAREIEREDRRAFLASQRRSE